MPLSRNPHFIALLLVALLCRALIPTGFMPGSRGVTLCPAYGARSASVSMLDMLDPTAVVSHAEHGRHTGNHDGAAFCPYGAAAGTIGLPSAPSALLTLHYQPGQIIFPPDQSRLLVVVAPSPLPRGPPLTS